MNYLLEYGINSDDENIASGAMRHLPIILLKNFRSVDLDLTPLIKSLLLKKHDPDAAQVQGYHKLFFAEFCSIVESWSSRKIS